MERNTSSRYYEGGIPIPKILKWRNEMMEKTMYNGMIKVKDITPNPNNPRTIKKEQLDKLKRSIQGFPEMLYLRPIVLNSDKVILGGNMRLRALKELNIEEVPYIQVTDLTPEQENEFIVKDNLNYGDWNWDLISQDWNLDHLNNWGLDIPKWLNDDEAEPEFDENINHKYLHTYINSKVKQIVMFLSAEQYETAIKDMERIMENEGLESNTEVILYLIEKYYEKVRTYTKED